MTAIFDLPVTLTLYRVAAGLSLGLCRISGANQMLPSWATVIGTNVLLLSAGPLKKSGSLPLRVMALLVTTLSVWMAARFVLLFFSEPLPPNLIPQTLNF